MTTQANSSSFLDSLTTLGLAYINNQNQAPAPAPPTGPAPVYAAGSSNAAVVPSGFSLSSPLVIGLGLLVVGILVWKKL